MDDRAFDALSRRLGSAVTRRAGLAGALAALVAALPAAARPSKEGSARMDGPRPEGPCGDGSARANRCKKNSDCCTKYCASGSCRCKPNWMACSKNDHCCSGRCLGGRCDGGAKPAGGACVENFNCQQGLACISGVCTASNTAKCTKQTCPGCCEGTICRPGSDRMACGSQGGACMRCSANSPCSNGTCGASTCSAATCPDGCCKNGECKRGTSDSACGSGGGTCATCSGEKTCQEQRCKSAGGGGGGGGGGCTSNADCSGSTPFCASGTCAECASNTDCSGSNADTCNSGVCGCGNAAACSGSVAPICSAGTCGAGTWNYSAQFSSPGSGDGNFNKPSGIFVSADTLTAWVDDVQNSRISIWTRPDATSSTWSYSARFGSYGTGDSNISTPYGPFVSADTLTAWVADFDLNRVVIWTRPDTTSTTWSFAAKFGSYSAQNSGFNAPAGIFVSADTLTAWVSNYDGNRISVWTRPDLASTSWSYSASFGSSGSGDGNLTNPTGLCVSADTLTAWVADSGNNRISIWTRATSSSTTWIHSVNFGASGAVDSSLAFPSSVFVSADTLTAWVASRYNDRISIWTRPDATSTSWSFSARFGTSGSGDGNFDTPDGVFVSADTLTAWIADHDNKRISIWTRS